MCDWKIVYQRFKRWARAAFIEPSFQALGRRSRQRVHPMIDPPSWPRLHQHSAGAEKHGAQAIRPIPRRTEPLDLRVRRRPCQSCRVDAQPGRGSRSDLRSTAHRSRRSLRFDRRQVHSTPTPSSPRSTIERSSRSFHPESHRKLLRARATSPSNAASASSLSVCSTSSSISGPSPPLRKARRELPRRRPPRLRRHHSSTEDRPKKKFSKK